MELEEDPIFAVAKKEIAASRAMRMESLLQERSPDNRHKLPKFVEDMLLAPPSSSSITRQDKGGFDQDTKRGGAPGGASSSSSLMLSGPNTVWSTDALIAAALDAPEQHFRQKSIALEAMLEEEKLRNKELVKQLEWEGRQLQQSHARVEDLANHAKRFQALLEERDRDVAALRIQLKDTIAELRASACDMQRLQEENRALTNRVAAVENLHAAEVDELQRLVLTVTGERAEMSRQLVAAKAALEQVSPSLASSLPSVSSLEDAASPPGVSRDRESSPEANHSEPSGNGGGGGGEAPRVSVKRKESSRAMKKMLMRVIDGLLRSLNEDSTNGINGRRREAGQSLERNVSATH